MQSYVTIIMMVMIMIVTHGLDLDNEDFEEKDGDDSDEGDGGDPWPGSRAAGEILIGPSSSCRSTGQSAPASSSSSWS